MTRRTPPSMNLYPDDFVAGTCSMSVAQVGVYIRLLCFQWSRGHVPSDVEQLQRITGVLDADEFGELWAVVSLKFRRTRSGKLVNKRLRDEYRKVRDIAEKRATAGQKGGRSNGKQKTCKGNMVDGKKEKKKKVPPTLTEVTEYARSRGYRWDASEFFDHYQSNGWKVGGKSPMQDWQASVRNWDKRRKSFGGSEQAAAGPKKVRGDAETPEAIKRGRLRSEIIKQTGTRDEAEIERLVDLNMNPPTRDA